MSPRPSTSVQASPSLTFSSADPIDESPSPTTASSSRHEEVATPTFASIRDRDPHHDHDLPIYPQSHDSSTSTYPDEAAQATNGQMSSQSVDVFSSNNLLSQTAIPSTLASLPNHNLSWNAQSATFPPYPSAMTLPVPSHVVPRVHPHLGSALYISSVPPQFKEESLAEILRDCLPVRISLSHPVLPGERIMPNQFYEWMPKSGLLQFDQLLNMERALATLPNHPILVAHGIVISPYPTPHTLPFPVPPTPARQIRPSKRVQGYETPADGSPTQIFMAQCPSPGELFDAVRPWGSVRSVSVWIQQFNELSLSQLPPSLVWAARVEFWYEDEAQRFDIGFGQTGSTIKGWQMSIASELIPSMISMPLGLPHPSKDSHPLPPTPETYSPIPPLDVSRVSPNLLPNAFGVNSVDPNFHMPSTVVPRFPFFAPNLLNTPPSSEFQLPWSNHVRLANQQYPLSPPHYDSDISMSTPATPVSPRNELHSRMSSHGSMTNLRDPRREVNKKWQVALDPSPNGGLVATGLVSDEGKFIPHGPGQHIRPAPVDGPGSRSSSGLVDYANIYVKNLDPDINSAYLAELFDHTGKIISARVMRDDRGASRGFGFVSFRTPDDASQAIRIMNNAKVGTRLITVSLHEPRMVRPDKIAERVAKGEATFLGRKPVSSRRSSSPTRTDRRGRLPIRPTGPMPPGTTDDIRLLSPKSRTTALMRRVKPRVEHYAKHKGISKQYLGPTVDALVSLDLGLIPLLHDANKLDNRIAEIVDELRDDPESIVNVEIRSGSRPENSHALTEIELAELRVEVERIDPLEVNAVIQAMLKKLTVAELRHCLDNKSKLAIQYGVAKRSLITAHDVGELPNQGMDPSPADSGEIGESQLSTPPLKVFLPVDIDNLTISKFVSLSINDMALHLSGHEAGKILDQLAIKRPTAQAFVQANAWTAKVMAKGIVERKAEMAALLAKMLDVSTLKRSQKTKVARNLVSAEMNDEAMCQLMRYPELVDAKVRSFIEKEEADGRGVDVAT
ncbi:hypothetical protein BCR39DRAFT_557015 [Naematelia encephala]|uniref:RRM domain-containing protein n=1 Tax=Naematelia encephala TaxID=71784 RepID=A0A1Y2BG37_9TREE|nr:hypothetical protein BCR39DRAFT_557015 [Naematelia encephala]